MKSRVSNERCKKDGAPDASDLESILPEKSKQTVLMDKK
jgi:hypothetical protein